MVKVNGNWIELKHLVVFDNGSKIFAAGRECSSNSRKQLRLFLINEHTGEIFSRNGRAESWELVSDSAIRDNISGTVYSAYQTRNIPVYRIHGEFNA